jgi:hypothetical protein
MIVLSALVACCSRLTLICLIRIYATILIKFICSSDLKCALPNRSISI